MPFKKRWHGVLAFKGTQRQSPEMVAPLAIPPLKSFLFLLAHSLAAQSSRGLKKQPQGQEKERLGEVALLGSALLKSF